MADTLTVWQHHLADNDGSQLICWLDRRLKVDTRLTLVETGDREWTVRISYSLPENKQDLHRPWKVGGLK